MVTLATCKLAVSPPLALHQPRITQIIIWLLQHHLVIQLHTYVTQALDEGMTTSCRNMSQEELNWFDCFTIFVKSEIYGCFLWLLSLMMQIENCGLSLLIQAYLVWVLVKI